MNNASYAFPHRDRPRTFLSSKAEPYRGVQVRAFSNKLHQRPTHKHSDMPTNVVLGADTANTARKCASHYELLHYINNKTVGHQQQQRTRTPLCITTARLMQHHHQICHHVTPQTDCTSHTSDTRTTFHSNCNNVHRMLSCL